MSINAQAGTTHPRVDRAAIEFGQTVTAGLLVLAFVADAWLLAAAVGVANLTGAIVPTANPMRMIYRLVAPRLGIRPRRIAEDPAPHRFAQGFSGTATLAGASAVAAGVPFAGWGLALMVAGLAVVNVTVGFCAGCFTYHQLTRLGIAGRTP